MTVLALPIVIPFVFMIIMISPLSARLARFGGVLGSFLLLMVSVILLLKVKGTGILTLYIGAWEAPFGISFVADPFSAIMLVVSSVVLFSISLYAIYFLPQEYQSDKFYVFFFTLALGLNGSFLTGDVFNLYVWFEVMLLSSFVLMTLGKSRDELRGGIKYLALSLLGSLAFLAGIGLLYGNTGTLNMAHLAQIVQNSEQNQWLNTPAMLIFLAFGIKAAVFPLFFWLPASYHHPNITISSLFAGLLTKVGVYAMIRFFTMFFIQDPAFWHNLILIIAGFTMVVGGMAATTHYDTRRILSFHIISQIGYMVMGLGIFTPLGIAGAIFFMIHNMIAKTNTFLVAGMINKLQGTFDLKNAGNLLKENPFLAVLFIVPAFALAGIPPVSGFFGKFILIKAGIDSEQYLITAVAIFTGLLTLYSMIKIWNEAFLKKQEQPSEMPVSSQKLSFREALPSVILGVISILLGIFAAPVFEFTMDAAEVLLNTSNYIDTVLK
ncbi:MAG: proton-conducting transporter membrane subunit [Bacteroidales bacterium]